MGVQGWVRDGEFRGRWGYNEREWDFAQLVRGYRVPGGVCMCVWGVKGNGGIKGCWRGRRG